MNFQQLRIVRETVRRNFNLTEVANTLYTSQSGVSKHIKDMEDELGILELVDAHRGALGIGTSPHERGIHGDQRQGIHRHGRGFRSG